MAEEIVRKSDSKLVAYACSECGILYSVLSDTDGARDQALKASMACCPPRKCTQCQSRPVLRGQPVCEVCAAANERNIETARFAAATKVPEAQWTGPVYWLNAPFAGDHGGFFWSSIGQLRKDLGERNQQRAASGQPVVSMPAYVYATKSIPFKVDGRAAVLEALEAHSDTVEIAGDQVAALQAFLDEWAKKQVVQSYDEDLTKAVILG